MGKRLKTTPLYGQISFEMPLLYEIQKLCGWLELKHGVHVSKSYVGKCIFVDFLACLRGQPPNKEVQAMIYGPIGGYRPTLPEFFLPMPTNPQSGENESCQSQKNNENEGGSISEPATLPPSSV